MLISWATSQSKLKGFSFDSGVLRIVSGRPRLVLCVRCNAWSKTAISVSFLLMIVFLRKGIRPFRV